MVTMAQRRRKPVTTWTNESRVADLVDSLSLDRAGAAAAQIALTLAKQLDAAEPKECAAIAKQLATVLDRLAPPGPGDDDDDWTAPDPA